MVDHWPGASHNPRTPADEGEVDPCPHSSAIVLKCPLQYDRRDRRRDIKHACADVPAVCYPANGISITTQQEKAAPEATEPVERRLGSIMDAMHESCEK